MEFPLARTPDEAHAYLLVNPCGCGRQTAPTGSAVLRIGDTLVSRYTRECRVCGENRDFLFRMPDDTVSEDSVLEAMIETSQLLDPGEWMLVAEHHGRAVPADITGLDLQQARTARVHGATAAAAVSEIIAFAPLGTAYVPPEAFRTARGRVVYAAEPGRFSMDRLQAVRRTYRDCVRRLDVLLADGQVTAPPTAGADEGQEAEGRASDRVRTAGRAHLAARLRQRGRGAVDPATPDVGVVPVRTSRRASAPTPDNSSSQRRWQVGGWRAARRSRREEVLAARRDVELAESLNDLSVDLVQAGRPADALVASEEAVEILWRLAEDDPATYEPALALPLTNLAVLLAESGRREAGLAASQEAVQISARVAEADPGYKAVLAKSLDNLSVQLWDAGRHDDSLLASMEAVWILEHLIQADSTAHGPDLTNALCNLLVRYAQIGRREEALDAGLRAVRAYRRLAEADLAEYEPVLAVSLNTLLIRLTRIGLREEALAASRKAVKHWRYEAGHDTLIREPALQFALLGLSRRLAEAGRHEEAEAVRQEAGRLRSL